MTSEKKKNLIISVILFTPIWILAWYSMTIDPYTCRLSLITAGLFSLTALVVFWGLERKKLDIIGYCLFLFIIIMIVVYQITDTCLGG